MLLNFAKSYVISSPLPLPCGTEVGAVFIENGMLPQAS